MKNSDSYDILKFFNLRQIFILMNLLISIFSIGVFIQNERFLILGIMYLFYFSLLFFVIKIKISLVSLIILTFMLIRYILIPNMYFTEGTLNVHYNNEIQNFLHVELFMIYEMSVLFIVLYFTNRKIRKFKIDTQKITYVKSNLSLQNLYFYILLGLTILLLVIFPNSIRFFNDTPFQEETISNGYIAIFQVLLIVSSLTIIDFFMRYFKNNSVKYLGMITVLIFLSIFSSFLPTSISRNIFLINALIMFTFVRYFFKQYYKLSAVMLVVLAVLYFAYITLIKQGLSSDGNILLDTFKSFSNYSTLNSYFAGPSNIDIGLRFSSVVGIKPFLIINDIFANSPYISGFIPTNTVTMFNHFIFRGISNDQIIPLSIQSTIYFSILFAPLLVGILSYLSVIYYWKADKTKCLITKYTFLYVSFLFSLSQIISLNAISMLIIIRVLPVLAIFYVYKKIFYKKGSVNV